MRGSNVHWTSAGEEARNTLTMLPGLLLEAAMGGIVSSAVHLVVCMQFAQKTMRIWSICVHRTFPTRLLFLSNTIEIYIFSRCFKLCLLFVLCDFELRSVSD